MLCDERQMSTSYNDEEERVVFVRNLDEKVSKKILEELFVQMGTVVKVVIKESKTASNVPKNIYAFVEFQDPESVLFAVEMLDDIELYGKKIVVAPRDKTFQAENYKYLRQQFLETRTSLTPNIVDEKKHNFQYSRQSSRTEPLKKKNYEHYVTPIQSFSRNQNVDYLKTKKRNGNYNNKNYNNLRANQSFQSTSTPVPFNQLKNPTASNFNSLSPKMSFFNELPSILKNFNFPSLPPKRSYF